MSIESIKLIICLNIGCAINFLSVFLLILHCLWLQKQTCNMGAKPPGSSPLLKFKPVSSE